MQTSLLVIPRFIEAKTKPGLMALMLTAQRRFRKKLHFFDIQFANGKWVAWYELDIREKRGIGDAITK